MFEPKIFVTEDNKFSGSGPLDSYTGLAKSIQEIKTADDADKAALGVEIGIGVVSSVIDTIKLAFNPLATLISAGLGWLIEHVGFLRDGLDALTGDPDAIQRTAEEMHQVAEALRQVAEQHKATLAGPISEWTGEAGDAFREKMKERVGDIEFQASRADVAGYVVHGNMAVISALRALIRDTITSVLADFISVGLIALASAIPTAGASIAGFIGYAVGRATLLAAEISAKLAKLVAAMARVAGRLSKLAGLSKKGDATPAKAPGAPPKAPDKPLPPPPPVKAPDGPATKPSNAGPAPDKPLPDPPKVNDGTPPPTKPDSEPYGVPGPSKPPKPPGGNSPPTKPNAAPSKPPGEPTTPSGAAPPKPGSVPPGKYPELDLIPPMKWPPPSGPLPDPPIKPPPGPKPKPGTDNGAGVGGPPKPPKDYGPAGPPPNKPLPDPPPKTPDTPKPPDAPKPAASGPWMKKHENFLKGKFPDEWAKLKYFENLLKKNFPDVHAKLRFLYDTDSAKEYIGQLVKPANEFVKQMLDIQASAKKAYAEEQAKDTPPA